MIIYKVTPDKSKLTQPCACTLAHIKLWSKQSDALNQILCIRIVRSSHQRCSVKTPEAATRDRCSGLRPATLLKKRL